MARISMSVFVAAALLCSSHSARSEEFISQLRVEQAIAKNGHKFEPASSIRISFVLSQPAEVAVVIERHLATIGGDAHGDPPGNVGQYHYVAEPLPVRTLALGRLAAGHHTAVWDGLTADRKPVTETQVYPYKQLAREQKAPEKLMVDVPANHFRVTVRAGGEELAANFERAAGRILASREIPNFTGAVFDSGGNILVAALKDWRGRRYTPHWRFDQEFPADPRGHSSNPIHCYDAAVDSKDNLYLASNPGVYRYDAGGNPKEFDCRADYIIAQYPIRTRNMLGFHFNKDQGTGTTSILLGTGRVEYNIAEKVKEPGFVYEWGGLAIDADDNIYVGEADPQQRILVFAPSGEFQRSIPVPEGRKPRFLRVAGAGRLWIATDRETFIVDRNSGELLDRLNVSGNLHKGQDGTMCVCSGSSVWRFSADGKLLPFDRNSPYVSDQGILNLDPKRADAPEQALGYANHVFCVVGAAAGDFFISAGNTQHPWRNSDSRILHFSRDGHFLPDELSAVIEQHVPGNLFLDDSPARFELYVNNLASEGKPITASWTVTDFDGKEAAGTATYNATAQSRQALPLT
ncbi:MAG TPA: hypothetical protein VM223_16120, partial [Planctomycetota bacterium]|nr:hypothetical protein [Planctomycetota bacterium]